jgi:hypothetical protein
MTSRATTPATGGVVLVVEASVVVVGTPVVVVGASVVVVVGASAVVVEEAGAVELDGTGPVEVEGDVVDARRPAVDEVVEEGDVDDRAAAGPSEEPSRCHAAQPPSPAAPARRVRNRRRLIGSTGSLYRLP